MRSRPIKWVAVIPRVALSLEHPETREPLNCVPDVETLLPEALALAKVRSGLAEWPKVAAPAPVVATLEPVAEPGGQPDASEPGKSKKKGGGE